jgi:hypothetical protein
MPQVLGYNTANGWYWSKSDLRSAMKIDAHQSGGAAGKNLALFSSHSPPALRVHGGWFL